jgi:putative zinc finger protein
MTCTETRDLFSALADDALAPAERAALDAHLAGCAECRRELAAFGRTVAMVRAIDPAHAPAGFVDRVLAAARPEPWRTWLARRLSAPWPTLPLGAAALLLVAGLAVLLFRASPEQQQTARQQSAPPGPTAPAPARETAPSGLSDSREADASRDAGASATPTREVAPAAPPPAARAPEPPARAADVEAARNRLQQAAPTAKSAETSVEPTAPARDAPPPAPEGRRAKVDSIARDAAGQSTLRQKAAPLSRTGPMTGILAAPPDVTAQLRAADVSAAELSLIELAGRLGGRQTGRRIDGGRVVVELAVPREAYAQFVREAAALGPLSIEQQSTDRPLLSVAVTVSN